MPFDALTMAAARDEIADRTIGSQIQRIVQPSEAAIALQLYGRGSTWWLVASADARFARVHLTTDRMAKAFPTPSMFVMLLRKYIEGTRVASVEQVPYERVLRIACGPEEHRSYLVVEVMGKHSNILLVDAEERVLGAVKIISARQSRVRPVLPGTQYELPPKRPREADIFGPGSRVDPAVDPEGAGQMLLHVPEDTPVRDALMGLFPGASPFLVDQVCARAGVRRGDLLQPDQIDRILEAAEELFRLYRTRDWRPNAFLDQRGRCDFAPYTPLGVESSSAVERIGEAVERCLGGQESRDALSSIRKTVSGEVERALRAADRRVASLWEGLAASEEADAVMQRGQLLLAYQWAATPGADHLDIPELDTTIPLDPALPVQENAEKLFRRYRKLRDASRRIPDLIAAAETEAARLHDLQTFVALADSESQLRELQRQVSGESDRRPSRKSVRRGPPRFHRGSARVVLGRNARENEEVTFRIASRGDLWFHARERTGAHVILLADSTSPDDETVAATAALAAYYSEGRQDTAVDVDLTEVRDVRKIPGGPPGRVTYRNFQTVRVTPSQQGWDPDRPESR